MSNTNSGIYKITNKNNEKFYIGSSKHIDRRWWEHKNDLIRGTHSNPRLQHAWNFHGENAFEFAVLESIEEDKLIEREDYYLSMFKPYTKGIGYNIGQKAYSGDNFTSHPNKEEIRQNLSNVNIGDKNPMFGKTHSQESIKLQKEKSVGRYTLEWFALKYGETEGTMQYANRNAALKNRKINYTYDNGQSGKIRGPMSNENKSAISNSKKRIKLIKNDIINDIKSELYTIKTIAEKYNISTTMVKYYKRHLKSKTI
jgi:group I intron endonuclease